VPRKRTRHKRHTRGPLEPNEPALLEHSVNALDTVEHSSDGGHVFESKFDRPAAACTDDVVLSLQKHLRNRGTDSARSSNDHDSHANPPRSHIASLPTFAPLSDTIEGPVLLKVGDDVSTDEIMPAGTRVLPFRSNIPRIAEFSFDMIDPTYAARARQAGGHVVVGGSNYGQGSSREHAALGPQFLGLRAVVVKSLARIHSQNLINFGVLPLTLVDPADYVAIQAGDVLRLVGVRRALAEESELVVESVTRQRSFQVRHSMSRRQVQFVLSGGLINWMKERLSSPPAPAHGMIGRCVGPGCKPALSGGCDHD
jgi:aconitase A